MIIQHLGWRWIFPSSAIMGLACIGITYKALKGEWTGPAGQRLDLVGALLYALALFFLVYGVSRLPRLNGILLTGADLTPIFYAAFW